MAISDAHPLDADRLEDLLEDILWSEASSKRGAAEALAGLARAHQDLVLHWVRTLEKDNSACAYQFLIHAHRALSALQPAEVEAWILHGLDVYDQSGLYAAVEVFRNVDSFLQRAREARVGALLETHAPMLERVVLGFSGRSLRLEVGDHTYTDTETLFLPRVTCLFDHQEDNFCLLKAMAGHLWAQTRFGTWRRGVIERLRDLSNRPRALSLFQALEALRLEARIARELPGMYRDMQHLHRLEGRAAPVDLWRDCQARLARPEASVEESLALMGELLDSTLPIPAAACFQGELLPERVEPILLARLEDEKAGLRSLLVRFRRDLEAERPAGAPPLPELDGSPFAVQPPEDELPDSLQLEITFHDMPVSPPDIIRRVMSSILLDLGEIPPDYLVPAGDGRYRFRNEPQDDAAACAEVWSGTYHERGARLYNEWDYRRESYRKQWCVLRELTLTPKEDDFIAVTRARYARHLPGLRRIFEALRGEDRWLKREPYGDEVDIDALVQARAEAARGGEMSDRLFVRLDRVERNIAVLFMVDMSGSTRGWINQAEREALVLLCEALETLGDRYAIYGFSGMTRKRCETYRIKGFDEAYGPEVQGRIAAIEPKDYTRMGVFIRHLSQILNQVEAKTRLLITISDGKPDDYSDEYRSQYGIEDTRRALIEAKRDGIHPFCITIDKKGQDYLPHMFGEVAYTLVDSVEQLPYKVSEIYRRLTA